MYQVCPNKRNSSTKKESNNLIIYTVTGIEAYVCKRRIAERNSSSVLIARVSKSERGK